MHHFNEKIGMNVFFVFLISSFCESLAIDKYGKQMVYKNIRKNLTMLLILNQNLVTLRQLNDN